MTETKQCADPSEKGCGEVKPESEFKPRKYLSAAGNVSIKRDKRCRECVNRNNRAGKAGVKTPIYHDGPDVDSIGYYYYCSSIGYYYYCRMPYPPMSKELREEKWV